MTDDIGTSQENNKKIAKLWFYVAFISLAVSGIFSIFIVAARSPHISDFLPHEDFFKTALTIHVNLSVSVWLLSVCCMIGSYFSRSHFKINALGAILAAIGSTLIALSVFNVKSEPYLNNYIPFIYSDVFKWGIKFFGLGVLISTFAIFFAKAPTSSFTIGVKSNSIIIISVFLTIMLVYLQLETSSVEYKVNDYYELLFWGGGHLMQFAFSHAMIIAWFYLLYRITNIKNTERPNIEKPLIYIYLLNLVLALVGFVIPFIYDVNSFEYVNYFTKHMYILGGIATFVAGLYLIKPFIQNYSKNNPKNIKVLRNCILWSVVLFATGGFIGLMINEVNTIIPAHYHGSIVGVSIALMGFCYGVMPKLGYSEIESFWAKMQPGIYGVGQIIHIIGFAISGGYGALRKTPGTEHAPEAKIYLGLMGLGGLISIIGGLIFIIVIIKTIAKKESRSN